ncbi:response regulator [Patescibacteria group bacterium]|nr:response regulator [Patescibacteria group bacterium]MBU4274534.1 response regulator [Patescibacteria group bacterium]MBU4367439.1 response regulator [Patescibacteria group bacterium]MBU4461759.1 response regulator [Patescibacteria group bacterium]MCG2700143.1 response regulator [Candidatus Parcubacteria bacterium]
MENLFDVDKILVVDDDRDITEAICTFISSEFSHITTIKAYDGNEAIDEFEKHFPAIIILDIMLPKRSGFLVMEKIFRITGKGANKTAPPIIIVITGNPGLRHKVYGESLGAWQYIFKPFRMEKLCNYVREALTIIKQTESKR